MELDEETDGVLARGVCEESPECFEIANQYSDFRAWFDADQIKHSLSELFYRNGQYFEFVLNKLLQAWPLLRVQREERPSCVEEASSDDVE